MPEELVLEARGSEDYISLHQKVLYGLRWGSKGHHIVIEFHHSGKYWMVEDQYEDYELRAQGKPDSFGSYPFHGPTIDSAIEWVEKTYDVKISIVDYMTGKPVPMEEVRARAQRELEEAVAPKPHEIGLFELMESNSEQVLKGMGKDITSFCTRAGVGRNVSDKGFAESTCKELLEGIVTDLDLEIPNENWSDDLKYGNNTFQQGKVPESIGRHVVKMKLKEIIDRDLESAEYRCEELWGVAPRQPYSMAKKEKAQQIAERLFEPFDTMERERLNKVGDETARKLESELCKNAAKLFFQVYLQSMKKRVEHLS